MKVEDLSKPTVAITYVLLSLELAAERGLARESLLKDLGISARQLQQADARIPFLAYGRLCARILRLSGDAAIGYEFGLRSTLTVHGFMGLGLLAQRTVRESVEFATEFAPRVRSPGFNLRHFVDGEDAVIDLTATVQYGPLHQYAIDMQLVSVAGMLAQTLTPQDVTIWFDCAEPDHYARYRERLPTVRFGMGANQVRFAASLLDRPLVTANAVTAELVRKQCERDSLMLNVADEFPVHVRALLANHDLGYPDLDTIAARLHISSRTLKRRLQQHGVSFQQLVNEARQRDAVRLLKETSLSIEQIAEQLGYSEASNFVRAFRRMTGRTPSEVRAR
ncbi:MAG: AraC family transcriptional regulator ligand-binding domain-containing protein [Sinimarinibacterium sp.]|jgi:AraC-like DNA-binding protein